MSDTQAESSVTPKPSNDNSIPLLGPKNNAGHDLGVVGNDPSPMEVVIEALKKKGVRFDESNFQDGDIERLNNDVVILRGDAAKILDCFFEGIECSPPRQ